jgi:hypothetical protein
MAAPVEASVVTGAQEKKDRQDHDGEVALRFENWEFT